MSQSGESTAVRMADISEPVPILIQDITEDPKTHLTQCQLRYPTGEVYRGLWLQVSGTQGYPHGYGIKYGLEDCYEGQWNRGLRHGQGKRVSSSGETYEGSWKDNMRHGYGVQTYVDGSRYEGGWKEDEEFGYGKMIKANNEVYAGGFLHGQEHGYAVRERLDGRKYEGGVKKGAAYGYGIGTYTDGRR